MYTSVVVRRWLQLNDVIRMGWSSHKDRWRNFISFYTGYKKHLFWRHTDALSSSMLDEHAQSAAGPQNNCNNDQNSEETTVSL